MLEAFSSELLRLGIQQHLPIFEGEKCDLISCAYLPIKRVFFADFIDRIKREMTEPQTPSIIRPLSPQLGTHLMLQRLIFVEIVMRTDKLLSLQDPRTSNLITGVLHSSVVAVLLHRDLVEP